MEELHYCLPDTTALLLIRGSSSFLLAGKAASRFPLCIEYFSGELCTTLEPDDIIAVSAPGGGALEPAVMLLELIRSHHMPLLVLPQGHPGSKRLRYVVSAGPDISLSCGIQRGTHPDQHILCSSGELAGLRLRGTPEGIATGPLPPMAEAGILPLPVMTAAEFLPDR
jgi:hypothetical protein